MWAECGGCNVHHRMSVAHFSFISQYINSNKTALGKLLREIHRFTNKYLFILAKLLIASEARSVESLEARSAESRFDVARNARRRAQADANLGQGLYIVVAKKYLLKI